MKQFRAESALRKLQKQAFLDRFTQSEEQMLNGIRRNMRICSEKGSPTPDAPYGSGPKAALLDALEQARELGFRTCNLDNRIGYAEIGEGSEIVAILAHLDVVPAGEGWEHPPYAAECEDGILYGRGALDDKGPAIGALYSLKAIADYGLPLKRRIRVIWGTDEECGSSCVAHYLASKEEIPVAGFTPDADFPAIFCEKGCLILELGCPVLPDSPIIQLEGGIATNVVMPSLTLTLHETEPLPQPIGMQTVHEKGLCRYTALGKSAHGSTPHLGVNAGYCAADALANFPLPEDAERLFRFIREKLHHETNGSALGIAYRDVETGEVTVNLGCIRQREGMRYLTLDIRFPHHCDPKKIVQTVQAQAADCGLSLLSQKLLPLLYIPKDSPLIRTLTAVYAEQTGMPAEPIAIGGGTYAKEFPNIVAFGPVFPGREDVIHQPNERVAVRDLFKAIQISTLAIAELACMEL